jgi:DNA modification methylase
MKIHCPYDRLVPLSELRVHPKNANRHGDDQIERLAKILEYQGWRYPIKVSKRSGFMTSGHGRALAAAVNKWAEVPVSFQDYESEEQETADVHSDNAIASWAELDLSTINAQIPDLGPDFDLDLLGIKDFVLEPAEFLPGCDEDEVPEKVEPKTRRGDIYQLGRHRLMCGDSTMISAVGQLMGGENADITFTSPPYNAGVSAKLSGNTAIDDNLYGDGYDDNQTEDDWLSLVSASTAASIKFSRYQFWNVQFLAGNRTALPRYWSAFKDHIVDVAIWDKGHAQPAAAVRVLDSRFEFILIFTSDKKPSRAIRCAPEFRGTIQNVFEITPQRKNEFSATHAATFPVALPECFVDKFAPVSGSVLDLFGGTGTTMIACEKTNRRCFMMELDPSYCDIVIARWEKFTGNKAELLSKSDV